MHSFLPGAAMIALKIGDKVRLTTKLHAGSRAFARGPAKLERNGVVLRLLENGLELREKSGNKRVYAWWKGGTLREVGAALRAGWKVELLPGQRGVDDGTA